MIDADVVRRALRTPARIACCALQALLPLALLAAAVPASAAEAVEPPQRVLPWLKAQPAPVVVRRARPLPAVVVQPVAALLPMPVLAYARAAGTTTAVAARRGRPAQSPQQYAATLASPLPHVKVSSPFGNRVHPTRKRRGFHFGVDYSARPGTPILAAQDGEIKLLGRRRDFGNHLRIDHGHGVETLYGHLQRFMAGLKQGSKVKRGDVIGYVGATGRATGPHLHFEVLAQGRPVDPMKLALAVPPEKLLSIR